jgi:hypothetical protein
VKPSSQKHFGNDFKLFVFFATVVAAELVRLLDVSPCIITSEISSGCARTHAPWPEHSSNMVLDGQTATSQEALW